MSHRLVAACWAFGATVAAAQTPQLPAVDVVVTTPLGALERRDRVPANVQTVDESRLRDLAPANLVDLLGRHLGSVSVVETQGNPFQADVFFRGFTASPLLGNPQGLSVYVEGVRVNEPFGDVVNWDLVPKNAIAGITLVPGSNPLFGLNTLGGALAVRMKRGDTHPGTEAEVGFGSFGQRSVEVSHGLALPGGHHLYIAGTAFREDGWREYSPSDVKQLFLRGGMTQRDLSWDVSLTHARTDLIGNGPLPQTLLEARREQIYTRPDETKHRLTMLVAQGSVQLDASNVLTANAYLRRLNTRTLNGDLNDEYDPPTVPEAGVENRTAAQQRGSGASLQWSSAAGAWRTVAGVSHDRSKTTFEQTEAEGDLDPTRAVVPTDDPETDALIAGRTRTSSLYASATWEASPALHVTASGRYNRTRVTTVDRGRIELGLPTTLDGDATYSKLNPALGATWKASEALTVYGGWSQGNRAPSPIENGCSDPANPCVLPNALQSDPPLAQVVSRTVEAGVRGRLDLGSGSTWRWNASLFRTVNRDDILFISNSLAAGYFVNFGRTRREGAEFGIDGRFGAFDAAVSAGLLRATYRSGACVVSEANSTAETSPACPGEDEIEIRPGDRLPSIPSRTLKLDVGWRPVESLRLAASVAAQSGTYARGNENNRHEPDGVDFLGAGRTGGFALLNLDASWKFGGGWSIAAKVRNATNRKVSSGALLGENAFDAAGTLQAPAAWRNEQFDAPSAPRSFWIALRYGGE